MHCMGNEIKEVQKRHVSHKMFVVYSYVLNIYDHYAQDTLLPLTGSQRS